MKTEQSIVSASGHWSVKSNNGLKDLAQLVLLFGERELLKNPLHMNLVKQKYPLAQVVGCSTSGEIYNEEVYNHEIIVTALFFEKTAIEIAREPIFSMEDSFSVGNRLAERLDKEDLVHVLLFSEGLNINGSELTKGINSRFNDKISVTGGLAGDQGHFSETVTVFNTTGETNQVVAIGFYGKYLRVGYGSMGGWDSFGVDREVTKSKSNVLYELDGQPALDLYKRYLGTHAANLPASALLFPLNLRLQNSETSLVRTILSVNEENGSMVFAGDIPQGEYVRLMKTNFDRLIEGASEAAEMALLSLSGSNPDLAILISCVGRKLVLKQRVEEELETIREEIGANTAITGFYSYGEICPLKPFEQHCELHNQTMTITVFKEL